MRQRDFLALLRVVAPEYTWQVDACGILRGRRRDHPEPFCPLTAVFFHRTQRYLSPILAMTAGVALDLSAPIADKIMDAADGLGYPRLRRALVQACAPGHAGDV